LELTGTIADPPPQIGGYILLDKLGTGGMAEVFLAVRSGPASFEKLCVIKRILPHLAEEGHFITMFLDEARIAAGLNHPNIVQVYDLGFDTYYFMAMEYIEGISLARLVLETRRRKAMLDPYLVAGLAVQACDGLYHAHEEASSEKGPLEIIHRDINPRNLMVNYSGMVKIVDFGIAKARGRLSRTRPGKMKGTLSYMSPEQIGGVEVDRRSDIYSLGVVLYEMLVGKRLFKRSNEAATLNAVLKEDIAPLGTVRGDVNDPRLEAVIMKMLARDREHRYSSARDVQKALLEVLDHAGVRGRPPEIAEYMRKYHEEHRPKRPTSDPRDFLSASRISDTKPDMPMTGSVGSGSDSGPSGSTPRTLELRALPTENPSTVLSSVPAEAQQPPPNVIATVKWPWLLVVAGAAVVIVALASRAEPEPQVIIEHEPPAAIAPPVVPPVAPPVTPPVEPTKAVDPPPTAPPRPKQYGTLDVNCTPWGRVWIDGRDTGLDTPAQGIKLEAGWHTVELVHPPSGATVKKRVKIRAKKSSLVTVSLK
jgi:eukaryotic-like serine/threonine-protein kinase